MAKTGSKVFKLKPRERIFLKRLSEGCDIGDSYQASGFKCKNKNVACVAGSRLLRRLNESIPHREIGQSIIGVTEVYKRTKELMTSTDHKAAVKATDLAGQFMGMKDISSMPSVGVQIAIIQRLGEGKEQGRVDATQESITISETSKPLALKD